MNMDHIKIWTDDEIEYEVTLMLMDNYNLIPPILQDLFAPYFEEYNLRHPKVDETK